MTSPTITLAQALIRRPSVTPEDAGCQQLLAEKLSTLGFRCEHLRFGEGETAGPVDNLWAVKGDKRPLYCFAGHTDVVPIGKRESWTHVPFAADIKDDWLIGRGTADMKGSIAAMVTAVETFLALHPAHGGRIAFLLT